MSIKTLIDDFNDRIERADDVKDDFQAQFAAARRALDMILKYPYEYAISIVVNEVEQQIQTTEVAKGKIDEQIATLRSQFEKQLADLKAKEKRINYHIKCLKAAVAVLEEQKQMAEFKKPRPRYFEQKVKQLVARVLRDEAGQGNQSLTLEEITLRAIMRDKELGRQDARRIMTDKHQQSIMAVLLACVKDGSVERVDGDLWRLPHSIQIRRLLGGQ